MSAMSEAAHTISQHASQLDQPAPRMSANSWHTLVTRCAQTAWRYSALRVCYGEMYCLAESVLREAMPDQAPPARENVL